MISKRKHLPILLRCNIKIGIELSSGAKICLMEIIQVVQEFSRRGGIESVAYELDRAWRDKGARPGMMSCVYSEAHPSAHPVAPWLSRVATRGIGRHAGRALAMPTFAALATRRLRQMRQQGNDFVFLSHGDTLDGDVCVIHAVNRASLKAKQQDGEWRWRLNPLHAWVDYRDRAAIGGGRYRKLVAVSRRVVAELEEHYSVPPEAVEVIPNGVNLTRFSPEQNDREETRKALGIPADTSLLLFVGHEFGRKGLTFVLEALTHLPETRLLVVGAGEIQVFRTTAARLGVGERVHFLGARQDLPALNRAADALVLPTAYETFALVCIEAMACGLPVFATNVGGVEDYLRAGVNGFPITRDGKAIAALLRPLLAQPSRLKELGAGAFATAQQYGWDAISKRYGNLLGEVLATRRRSATSCA